MAWLTRQGIDFNRFNETRNSFAVQTKVNRARQLMIAYSLDSVPTIIVDGRYSTGIMSTVQAVPDKLNKLIIMARQSRQKK
jgi:thiol:disulfide interchange protein DsbA